MEYRRIGSIIQVDKVTGVYVACLIYENEAGDKMAFRKWFPEGGIEAAKRWSENYKSEMPQYFDKRTEIRHY